MKKIKFLSCKDGTLTIACLSSVKAEKIKKHEKAILWKLNKSFGKKVVDRIKLLG